MLDSWPRRKLKLPSASVVVSRRGMPLQTRSITTRSGGALPSSRTTRPLKKDGGGVEGARPGEVDRVWASREMATANETTRGNARRKRMMARDLQRNRSRGKWQELYSFAEDRTTQL